jgi:hypothetical protein
VSFYGDTVLPRLQDKAMNRQGIRDVRARVCAGLTGRVLEIGFGTGLNVRYYPTEVTTVLAVEPSRACMRIAAPRIALSNTVIEHAGLTGEHLDLPSEDVDVALSTWTLCTIPDLSAALGAPSISSSTATPPTPRRRAGNTGSIPSTRGSPEGAISPGASPSCWSRPAS